LNIKSDVKKVCKTILNQKIHHYKQTFTEVYETFYEIQSTDNQLFENKIIRFGFVVVEISTKVKREK